jgi:hypothetical protein
MTFVTFSLVDSTNDTFYSRVYVAPIANPVSYSGSLVVGDTIAIKTTENHPTKTLSLIPNQYRVRCIGGNTYDTEFYIVVPELNGGTINAADITTGSYTTGSWITMSYAATAGSASYAATASYVIGGGDADSASYATSASAAAFGTFTFHDSLNDQNLILSTNDNSLVLTSDLTQPDFIVNGGDLIAGNLITQNDVLDAAGNLYIPKNAYTASLALTARTASSFSGSVINVVGANTSLTSIFNGYTSDNVKTTTTEVNKASTQYFGIDHFFTEPTINYTPEATDNSGGEGLYGYGWSLKSEGGISSGDKRFAIGVGTLFGANGQYGSKFELLTKRDLSYSNASGVFNHPIVLDGYGHVGLGNNPESEHTKDYKMNAWVQVRPATTTSPQLLLEDSPAFGGTEVNGHIRNVGGLVSLTQLGTASAILTSDYITGSDASITYLTSSGINVNELTYRVLPAILAPANGTIEVIQNVGEPPYDSNINSDYRVIEYRVYSYKTIEGTRYYSQDYLQLLATADLDIGLYAWSASWDTVADAEGYRVVVVNDLQAQDRLSYTEAYFDIEYNNFVVTDLVGQVWDDGNIALAHDYTSGTPTLTPNSLPAQITTDCGLDLGGNLTVTGSIDFTGTLLNNGVAYVPANAATSSYLSGSAIVTLVGTNNIAPDQVNVMPTSASVVNFSQVARWAGLGLMRQHSFQWSTPTSGGTGTGGSRSNNSTLAPGTSGTTAAPATSYYGFGLNNNVLKNYSNTNTQRAVPFSSSNVAAICNFGFVNANAIANPSLSVLRFHLGTYSTSGIFTGSSYGVGMECRISGSQVTDWYGYKVQSGAVTYSSKLFSITGNTDYGRQYFMVLESQKGVLKVHYNNTEYSTGITYTGGNSTGDDTFMAAAVSQDNQCTANFIMQLQNLTVW